jgi:pfkB family carbohydrate kinase/Nucleoside 2-deoxyribosyltransferase
LNVVGGTYLELCQESGSFETPRSLLGSGLRAAAALRNVADDLVLHSAVDAEFDAEAKTIAQTFELSVEWRERSEPVAFRYWTPLSAPTISGPSARAPDVELKGGDALLFGMIESGTSADVDGLVLDPQQPRDLGPLDMTSLRAQRLAIVANAAETRAMTGESELEVAARRLRASTSAEVVVTKQAARGALVTSADAQELVGPWPTKRVWPIGSGDVFAAGFAWAWLERGAEPVEAARVGSHAASRWCATQSLDLAFSDFQPGDGELAPRDGRVYLAAPFFSLGQRWLVELARESLMNLGGDVFSPFHDVGISGDAVARLDLEGLERCSAVLALLDEADPGSMFEAGWAERAQLPTVVFSEHPDSEELKMVRGTGASVCSDLPSAVYQALWASMGAPS